MPRDLTRLTLAQVEWCVAFHAALPLSEIRRRQALADRQIGMAWRQRNDFALANLRVREEILRRAAERTLPAREGIAGRRQRPSPLREQVKVFGGEMRGLGDTSDRCQLVWQVKKFDG